VSEGTGPDVSAKVEMHTHAVERERDALAREHLARLRQLEAEQEAQAAGDPVLRRLHEHEAHVHERAAEIHRQAAALHAEHAEAHRHDPA
jgi:hypothetical protein